MKAEYLKILKENGLPVPDFDIIYWEDRNNKIDIKKYNGKYAVRSSCNLEDGENNSFAGQFDTFLNVSSNDLEDKVSECFNSINNKSVLKYLKHNNINYSDLKMNVIIQRMVKSDYSGVLFTANPLGILNESVIVVGKGLGNGVVEDKVDTTTYYYNLSDNNYYYEGKNEYLDSELIEELIGLSNKIKDIFGEYLDIEFAIEKGKVYILQTRPITTIDDSNCIILDNSNIVESYPGVSLPLTISFVKLVYSGVFEQLAFRLTHDNKLVLANRDHFKKMVGSANGRIYYQISNWYHLIKFLPFSKKIIPIWQDMMGVKNKNYDSSKTKIAFFTKIKTYYYIIKEFILVPKNMDILNKKYLEIDDYYHKTFYKGMSNKEIKKLYQKIKDDLLSMWDITLVNDLYAFLYTGLLKKKLKKRHYDDSSIQNYISGITNIESLKPIHSLISLAYQKDKLPKEVYDSLFEQYIYLYGDRNLEELKLESETFRTSPKLLEKRIKEYRSDMRKLELMFASLKLRHKKTVKEDFMMRFLSKRAMSGISNREISRLNRTRIYGMVREMFLEIGNNFVKEGKIHNKRDIFYLTIDEVFDKSSSYKDIIKERKIKTSLYKKLPNYSRIVFSKEIIDKSPKCFNVFEKTIIKDKLFGTPCSSGNVLGEALVIDDVHKNYDVKDKILITKMTDPGWVFLLATAKGVISEKGSLLSHTAIISREIGIPSIVGATDLCSIIHTGDLIRMNGTTGVIEIIKRGKK